MSNARQRNPEQGGGSLPPAKRQRILSKACEYCKSKKLRCDSSRPCESCSKKGFECVYKERGQPGLRPGYGKDVERRLSALEENYQRMDQMLKQTFNLGQIDDVSHTDEANSDIHLSADRHSYEAQAPSQSIPVNQPNMELPIQTTQTAGTGILATGPTQVMTSISPGSLPSAEVLLDLAELYFDLIQPWAPLFYKPNFMTVIFANGREILLHGLVVIAFAFWTKALPSLQDRNAYVEASRKHILLHCTDTCSIVSTQALALLAIDAIGQGTGARMWNILSILSASVQQLALTREPLSKETDAATPMVGNSDPENTMDSTAVAAEERRRLFWVIFSVDRFGSVALGQAGGISVNSIKLRHPTNDTDSFQGSLGPWFQPTDPIKLGPSSQPWNSYIELLSLLDRSNRFLIRPFDFSIRAHCEEWQCSFRMLDVTLNTWLENAPQGCRDPFQTFDPMWTMVRATFELIKLRLYTVAAFPSGSSTQLPPSASARARCRESIRIVTRLSSSLKPQELDRLSPSFAFVVWVAARSLVILWTSGYESTRDSIPVDVDSLMNVLRTMSGKWPCAGRSVEIIKLILDTHNDPDGASCLKIFKDTRRTSYGLEALLGPAALRQEAIEPDMFDFFNMTFPDVTEMNSFLEPLEQRSTQDWLV